MATPMDIDKIMIQFLDDAGWLDDLTRRMHSLSLDSYLKLNDAERIDNCVWVSTARILGFRSVSELEKAVHFKAPKGGAVPQQMQAFRIALQDLGQRKFGKPLVWTLLYNQLPSHSNCLVAFERPDGTCHCVLRENGRFVDYQRSDRGMDATADVQRSKIRYTWFFELARF